MNNHHKLICLVGLPGAGKSEVAEYLKQKKDFGYLRFGQITLDRIIQLKKKPSETLERKIREGLRKQYGMAAFAILNLPKINQLLKNADVIADGLYSWEEFLKLKAKYQDNLIVIAIFTPPLLRYNRLENRAAKHGPDPKLRYRSFGLTESAKRDQAQIEKLNQAGPIAMADYTILNIGSILNLKRQINQIYQKIYAPNQKKSQKKSGKVNLK